MRRSSSARCAIPSCAPSSPSFSATRSGGRPSVLRSRSRRWRASAVARGGRTAPGCGDRRVPAGRVRGRPCQGPFGQRAAGISRSAPVLQPYLSDGGLSTLLVGAAKRLSGSGGDPVVELQTNFGGGKTHSMLALYHMAGPTPVQDLSGASISCLRSNGLSVPNGINRAVLVGTSRGPQDVLNAEGGRKIRTTWGELAWQLGGADASHGRGERRQRHRAGLEPAGGALQEMRAVPDPDRRMGRLSASDLQGRGAALGVVRCEPVLRPVADRGGQGQPRHAAGGVACRRRRSRLAAKVVRRRWRASSRPSAAWNPRGARPSQEESYEIVRRRLFKEIPGDKFHHRDNTLKQFAKLYRENANDFPQGCADEDYRRKLEKAYPIHPELFDQLYTSWGSLEKFQRTRGVLRLMAQAIHELWMNADPSVMIMPGSVAVSSPRVEPELLHYLDVSWQSIIAGDVDGTTSTPYKIDQSAPNLNRYSATRRVARAIFMGTRPTAPAAEHRPRRQADQSRRRAARRAPGDLRRCAAPADQPGQVHARRSGPVLVFDVGEPQSHRADKAAQIEAALGRCDDRRRTRKICERPRRSRAFRCRAGRTSLISRSPDEAGGVRAVVLGVKHPHNGRDGSEALVEAKDILMQRGSTPRVYRNMLVFIAAEARQLDHLKDAVRARWLGARSSATRSA
jgi:hypothetical protein